MERISVLVADHDRWARSAIAAMLREAGADVLEASNGVSALRTALGSAPHVAVIGRVLPEIDPDELARGLRQDQRTRNIAIIGARESDAVDVSLALPCGPIELLGSIVRALQARHQAVAAAPIRSVIASPFGNWPLVEGGSSRATSRIRKAGRSGKWRLSNGIETL